MHWRVQGGGEGGGQVLRCVCVCEGQVLRGVCVRVRSSGVCVGWSSVHWRFQGVGGGQVQHAPEAYPACSCSCPTHHPGDSPFNVPPTPRPGDGPFSFCSYPFLLNPRAKSNLLHIEARFQMEQVGGGGHMEARFQMEQVRGGGTWRHASRWSRKGGVRGGTWRHASRWSSCVWGGEQLARGQGTVSRQVMCSRGPP